MSCITRRIKAREKAARVQNYLLAFYGLVAAGCTVAVIIMNQPTHMELAAYDIHGNRFVAGSGRDCPAAFVNAQIPADWRELACEEVR